MIKNLRAGLSLLLAVGTTIGCGGAQAEEAEAFQGVVEHEERVLGFELGGRLSSVDVVRGGSVEPGTRIAALDDTLDRVGRDARVAEVAATEAQLELVREGPRDEEIRAARAELRAARSSEELVRRNLERQRGLASRGASAPAQLDELDAQLARAVAQKQSLTQRLRALEEGARTQEVAAAEAQVAAARAALAVLDERIERYTLESGVTGSVLDVHAEPGEVVAPGAPIVTLADGQHPYVDVFVPQDDVGGVEIGTRARVRVDTYDEAFSGVVEHVARRTEFTPRFLFSERERPNLVIRVRIRVEDPEGRLPAGVPAFATLDHGGAR
jgi:HlyD family secretion protein